MTKFSKDLEKISEVQNDNEEELLNLNNVVGVSIGQNIVGTNAREELALSVLVSQKLPEKILRASDLVPKEVLGIKTDVVQVGTLFAADLGEAEAVAATRSRPDVQPDSEANFSQPGGGAFAGSSPTLATKMRPAMGGFSCGHYQVTAGTLGACCYDAGPFPGLPGKYYILSNNHVLANSNNANIGDPILQPGRIDGGVQPSDVIARLTRYVPIRFHSGTSRPINYVDAAIAEGDLKNLNRQIYWQGHVRKLYDTPVIGEVVQKTGRTTGFTTGKVTNVNATVDVNFGGGRIARFARQIITSAMSAPGDSGSVVLDREENAVGLLFAGSPSITILNNILYVQSLLGIRLTEL